MATKILYTARGPDGGPREGFVEAANAQQAVDRLRAAGFTEVQIHEDPAHASQTGRAGLSTAEEAQLARFHLRVRKRPGLATVLGEVARRNALLVVLDCAMFGWGLFRNNHWLMSAALAFLGVTFLPAIWRHREARGYDALVRAMAFGEWERAERLIARLQGSSQMEQLLTDLVVREAQIRARQGRMPEARALMMDKAWPRMAATPAQFHGRLAGVLAAGGDYAGFLTQMRKAADAAPDSPSQRLDLALAEARFGDPLEAEQLLARVDSAAIPASGLGFLHWARGLSALRQGRDARAPLALAVASFLEYEANPAVWVSLAFATGTYALALAAQGEKEAAKSALRPVWPILKVHGDKPLLTLIEREVGGPA